MFADSQIKFVFIGLGNPGKKYAKTRHNLGFMVIEELARSFGWTIQEEGHFNAKVGKGRVEQAEVHLLEPLTYMNDSGRSVRQYIDYYKLVPSQLVVVSDDTALPYGQVRLRNQGSAGGHNGLKSLIAHLGTEAFARLRMGIGSHDESRQALADYVLSDFTADESAVLDEFVKYGAAILKSLTTEEMTAVMSRVNRQPA